MTTRVLYHWTYYQVRNNYFSLSVIRYGVTIQKISYNTWINFLTGVDVSQTMFEMWMNVCWNQNITITLIYHIIMMYQCITYICALLCIIKVLIPRYHRHQIWNIKSNWHRCCFQPAFVNSFFLVKFKNLFSK